METRTKTKLKDSGQAGTSLVEVMMAGTILALAITATATMLRAGNDLMYKKNLERQARHIAYSVLEDPGYQFYPTYNTMPNYTSRPDTLDRYDRPIPVLIAITADYENGSTKENWGPYNSTFWRRVEAKVYWTVEGVPDSVSAVKLVGEVLR